MARFVNPNSEDDTQFGQVQDKTQDQTLGYGAPLQALSGSAGSGASAGAGAAPAAPQQRQSQFPNISRLLYANQGQGQQLAQNAVNIAGAKAGVAQTALNNAQRSYQAQAQAGIPQAAVAPSPAPVAPAPTQVNATGPGFHVSGPVGLSNGITRADAAAPNYNIAGSVGLTSGAVPTTTRAPDYSQVQQTADSVYTGPRSLTQAQGVNQAGLQGTFTDAARAVQALDSDSGVAQLLGRTGGVGALDSLLARREGRDTLRAGTAKFGAIRDMLNNAVKDTSVSDAAAAETAKRAAAAQGIINARDADAQAADTKKTDDANQAEAQRQKDDALYEALYSRGGLTGMTPLSFAIGQAGITGMPNGFASDEQRRNWFDANKDKLQQFYDQNQKWFG